MWTWEPRALNPKQFYSSPVAVLLDFIAKHTHLITISHATQFQGCNISPLCLLSSTTVTDFAKQIVFAHLNTICLSEDILRDQEQSGLFPPPQCLLCVISEHTSARVRPHREVDPGGLSPLVRAFLVSPSCLFDSLSISKASCGSLPDARLDQWTRDRWSWIVMFASLRTGTHTVAGRINGNFAAWR